MDILGAVAEGQVVDYLKSRTILRYCSVRIVLSDRRSVVNYKTKSDMKGIKIRGQFVMVVWNEHRVGPRKS